MKQFPECFCPVTVQLRAVERIYSEHCGNVFLVKDECSSSFLIFFSFFLDKSVNIQVAPQQSTESLSRWYQECL